MTIYFLIVFGFYFLLLLVLQIGLKISSRESGSSLESNKFISVVVAMRNETGNIENLLQSLSVQDYPPSQFEVIIIDDHSEDGSDQEAKKWIGRIPSLKVLSLEAGKGGKKAALALGISTAQGELIATTDADCIVPSTWLACVNKKFHSGNAKMCIGAVALANENTFFSKLQSIEFASVIGTGISLAAIGKPTMCNGANLSFSKKVFEQVVGYSGNEHIASGDDEFLLRKISAKYPDSIRLMTDCIISTKPQSTLSNFLHQRLRWASKWKHNSSLFARLLAIFVSIVQLSWIILVSLLIFFPSPIFVGLVATKITLDLILLSSTSRSLGMKFSWVAFAALQLLYPVYVLYIGFFSQLKNHQWKGRVI